MTMLNNTAVINPKYNYNFIRTHVGKLSAKDESALIALAQGGDNWARDVLIRCYEPFIIDTVVNYLNRDVPDDDLLQEARVGLSEAIDRFDLSRGFRLSSFGRSYIHKYISNALYEQGRTVKPSRSDWRDGKKAIISYDSDNENTNSAWDCEEEVEVIDYLWGLVEQAKWVLNEQELEVMNRMVFLRQKDHVTLREVADEMGVSVQRVGQIRQNAVDKLKVQALRYRACA